MSFITLIRPPFVYSKRAVSKPVVPPLAVAYLAALLQKAGHYVEVIDALGEGLSNSAPTVHPKLVYRGLPTEAIIERISADTNAIAVSCMFSMEWPHTEDVLLKIHKHFPSLPIIVGGEHATAVYEYILQTCSAVSCVALGEGEETLCEFAEFLENKKMFGDIAGLAFRANGKTVKTAPRRRIKDLDSLPLPAWDLTPLHAYHEAGYGYGVNRGISMPILATRGCPYQCTFCSNPLMWTTRYTMRSPQKVLDEIELYLNKYKATNIDFYDLTAILKREWILEFCRGVLKRKLLFTWQLPVGTRSEALDEEVLSLLYASGCRNVCYAPESGSERILKETKKRVHLDSLNTSLKKAKKKGLMVRVSIIIGFPQETRQDIYKTLALIARYAWWGVDDMGVCAFSPYPGSELYAYLRKKNVIPEFNNDYFASLGAFVDFTTLTNYCESVGPLELGAYRVLGMILFYSLSFLRRPLRVFTTLRNILLNKSETIFEQRFVDWLKQGVQHSGEGVREVVNEEVKIGKQVLPAPLERF